MKLPALPATGKGRAVLAAGILAGLLALWLAFILVDRLFILPREAAQSKGKAIAAEETAKAAGEAAREALTVTNEVHREYVRVEQITRRNESAIKQAAGAATRLPGVAAALHDSLCRRAAYSAEPDCAAVLGAGEGLGPAGSDPGSAAPAQ